LTPIKLMLAFTETAFSCTSPRRVVLDTNVLVSLYVFADSRFAPLRARIESGEWQAISSEACFEEFRRVLGYAMFALTEERRQAALAAYGAVTTRFAGPPSGAVTALPRCADRDDQKFLELARDSGADWLVTADKALLKLARRDRLRGLFRILTPETALAEI
jgi:putative PIN family toxin of toxin-antitoxin system